MSIIAVCGFPFGVNAMLGARTWILAVGLTTTLATSARAQSGLSVINGQIIGLATDPNVRKELGLDEEQVKEVKAAGEALSKRMAVLREQAKELEFKAPGSGAESLKVGRMVASSDYRSELKTILRPEQMKRLREITVQKLHSDVFHDPELRDELKLTTEQREKTDLILHAHRTQMIEIQRQVVGKGGAQAAALRSTELNIKTLEDVVEVLNDEQKKQWAAMQGPPFRISPRARS